MKLALTLTLSLTLSPRRGDPHFPRWNQSRTGKCSDALKSYSLSWGILGERVRVRADLGSDCMGYVLLHIQIPVVREQYLAEVGPD